MRDLILGMSMSLDGFLAAVNDLNDWVFSTSSQDGKAWKVDSISNAGVHVMGSRTFTTIASFWAHSADVFAKPMNDIPKVVFSRSGRPSIDLRTSSAARSDSSGLAATTPSAEVLASWQDARVASGSLVDEIEKLKREDGKPIFAHGGATFAQSLVRANLVDEYRLAVHPVALGVGKPLFASLEARSMLSLVDCKRFDGGTLGLVYRRR